MAILSTRLFDRGHTSGTFRLGPLGTIFLEWDARAEPMPLRHDKRDGEHLVGWRRFSLIWSPRGTHASC